MMTIENYSSGSKSLGPAKFSKLLERHLLLIINKPFTVSRKTLATMPFIPQSFGLHSHSNFDRFRARMKQLCGSYVNFTNKLAVSSVWQNAKTSQNEDKLGLNFIS